MSVRTILLGILLTTAASADVIGTVTLNTSTLGGFAFLDFQLIDGSGTGDGNNTVTISDFQGSIVLLHSSNGNVVAQPVPFLSMVTLTDTQFFNEAQIESSPPATFSFKVNATQNTDAIGPDTFTFAILNSSGNEIPTNNPNSFNSFLEIDMPGPGTGTVITVSQDTAGLGINPTFTPAPVPEPNSMLLCGALLALGTLLRRRLEVEGVGRGKTSAGVANSSNRRSRLGYVYVGCTDTAYAADRRRSE